MDGDTAVSPLVAADRWKRPILPVAMLQGYAGFYVDRESRRIRIWREIDDDELDALPNLDPIDPRRCVTVIPTAEDYPDLRF